MILRLGIDNPKQLQGMLAEFAREVQETIALQALMKAAVPIEHEIKRLAPVDPESRHPMHMRDQVERVPEFVGGAFTSVLIQIGREGFYKGDAYYAGFVEYGHHIGKRPRGGKRRGTKYYIPQSIETRGFVAARPFFRPGFDNKVEEAVRILGYELQTNILEEWHRGRAA